MRILVLDVDQTEEERDLARFRENFGRGEHLWAMDRDFEAAEMLGITVLDTTVIIDREGRIAFRDAAPTPHETLAAAIEALR